MLCWMCPFVILGVSVYFVALTLFLMEIPVSNRVDPDQVPHYVVSDLGLHCFSLTLL